MANPEHLEILKKRVGVWNKWRKRCPAVGPDLSGADLSGVDFSLACKNKYVALGAVMAGKDVADVVECGDALRADLRKARLAGARLGKANLFGADLSEADLHSAHLQNAQLTAALLEEFADCLHADLQNRGVRCWFALHDMPSWYCLSTRSQVSGSSRRSRPHSPGRGSRRAGQSSSPSA